MPHKRKAYDSVDPTIDDDVPAEFGKNSKKDFFEVSQEKTQLIYLMPKTRFFLGLQTFGPVFERNGRWSTKKGVPKLGNDSTPRETLDKFYKFWYEFESWREYSYLDEEDKEKVQPFFLVLL